MTASSNQRENFDQILLTVTLSSVISANEFINNRNELDHLLQVDPSCVHPSLSHHYNARYGKNGRLAPLVNHLYL